MACTALMTVKAANAHHHRLPDCASAKVSTARTHGTAINHPTMRPGECQNQRLKRPRDHMGGTHSGGSCGWIGSKAETLGDLGVDS